MDLRRYILDSVADFLARSGWGETRLSRIALGDAGVLGRFRREKRSLTLIRAQRLIDWLDSPEAAAATSRRNNRSLDSRPPSGLP